MILVDYSQVALSAILTFQRELKGTESEVKNLIRHVTLSTIKSYKKKYGKEYGELIICCDGRKYWRRDVFQYYKAGRKKARDASELDWTLIFDTLSEMRNDISKHFPWKVIHIDRAEADDVIAVMAKWSQTNGFVQQGLMEDPQKVLILSSDGDFIQLQKWGNVSQYSPMQKKQIKATQRELHEKFITHVVKAGDDGIPNILSPDDIFLQEGVRQKRISSQRLDDFLEKGFNACRNDDERRNWHRNLQLIDFEFIPEDVAQSIVDAYLNNKPTGDKMSVMNYLIENRCRLLLDELDDF
jgi:hypothetical protein